MPVLSVEEQLRRVHHTLAIVRALGIGGKPEAVNGAVLAAVDHFAGEALAHLEAVTGRLSASVLNLDVWMGGDR